MLAIAVGGFSWPTRMQHDGIPVQTVAWLVRIRGQCSEQSLGPDCFDPRPPMGADFMTSVLACAAGIDIGRDFLDVAIAPSGRSFRAPNAPKGVAVVTQRLIRLGVQRVVLESIGAYGQRVTRALAEAGFSVAIVDPRRIGALRLAEGKRAKTLALRALSTRRRQLVEIIAMEKTRLKQALDAEIAASHRAVIVQLSALRADIERDIETRVRVTEGGGEKLALLQTIPGIGPAVAATLVVDLPEIGTLGVKQIASLAGLAPHPRDSGAHHGVRAIAGGRSCVRAALYMAALSAARSPSGYKRDYDALRAAGKPAKVALIAIARKLAVVANAVVKSGKPWNGPAAA